MAICINTEYVEMVENTGEWYRYLMRSWESIYIHKWDKVLLFNWYFDNAEDIGNFLRGNITPITQ